MSLDLEWDRLLQSSLSSTLVDLINSHLSTTPRPSFIGPVTVTSLDFGSTPPDIEVVDIRDIYRDFLEEDENEDAAEDENEDAAVDGVKVGEGGSDVDGFEWVSRKATNKALAEEAPAYHHVPPHLRYGRGPATDPFSAIPGSPRDMWSGAMSLPNLGELGHASPLFRSTSGHARQFSFSTSYAPDTTQTPESTADQPASSSLPEEFPAQTEPNLQLHLHISYQSDLRLSLTTSLLINYPSPSFMSLPIKLSVTGLIFTGEVVVAYEGARHRVHLCILDDMDPYGPAGDRSNRHSMYSNHSTPPDLELPLHQGKPLPVGMRLLPSIFIESEIGQADKHALKNVTRVERFIQDVIRKTIEEELVFPNFHTLILGDQ